MGNSGGPSIDSNHAHRADQHGLKSCGPTAPASTGCTPLCLPVQLNKPAAPVRTNKNTPNPPSDSESRRSGSVFRLLKVTRRWLLIAAQAAARVQGDAPGIFGQHFKLALVRDLEPQAAQKAQGLLTGRRPSAHSSSAAPGVISPQCSVPSGRASPASESGRGAISRCGPTRGRSWPLHCDSQEPRHGRPGARVTGPAGGHWHWQAQAGSDSCRTRREKGPRPHKLTLAGCWLVPRGSVDPQAAPGSLERGR
jgi:hypothetical protein